MCDFLHLMDIDDMAATASITVKHLASSAAMHDMSATASNGVGD